MPTEKNSSNEDAQRHASSQAPFGKNEQTNKSHGSGASSSSISGAPGKGSINRSQSDKAGSGSSPDRDGAVEQVSEGANLNVENEASYGSSASGRISIEDSEAGTEGNNNR